MLSLQLASHVETRRYLPVCYGGGFVATRPAVHRVPKIAWERIVESLSRGDNVEESHYMERMWAALLTPPLTPSETRAMACVAKKADREMLPYLTGSVNNCFCGDVERCGAGLDGSKGRHMASANHSALHSMPEGEVEVEEECLKVLALHQPVATDLRFIVAILKINNDLERIGDLACNIASRARKMASITTPAKAHIDFQGAETKVRTMLRKSLEALVNVDADLAKWVWAQDDQIDEINRSVHKQVIQALKRYPDEVERLILLLSVSRNLERIGDHSTNIAEDILYMIGGEIVRHSKVE
jgi:phosphate transport system protein